MGSNVNPVSFFGSSSIIDQGLSTPITNREDAQQAFLKMLLEKVFLNGFQNTPLIDNNEDSADSEFSVFNNNAGSTIVNDMFRQQLTEQIIQNDTFKIDALGGSQSL